MDLWRASRSASGHQPRLDTLRDTRQVAALAMTTMSSINVKPRERVVGFITSPSAGPHPASGARSREHIVWLTVRIAADGLPVQDPRDLVSWAEKRSPWAMSCADPYLLGPTFMWSSWPGESPEDLRLRIDGMGTPPSASITGLMLHPECSSLPAPAACIFGARCRRTG